MTRTSFDPKVSVIETESSAPGDSYKSSVAADDSVPIDGYSSGSKNSYKALVSGSQEEGAIQPDEVIKNIVDKVIGADDSGQGKRTGWQQEAGRKYTMADGAQRLDRPADMTDYSCLHVPDYEREVRPYVDNAAEALTQYENQMKVLKSLDADSATTLDTENLRQMTPAEIKIVRSFSETVKKSIAKCQENINMLRVQKAQQDASDAKAKAELLAERRRIFGK